MRNPSPVPGAGLSRRAAARQRRRRKARNRRIALGSVFSCVALIAAFVVVGAQDDGPGGAPVNARPEATVAQEVPFTTPALDAALARVMPETSGHVTIGVVDEATGQRAIAGDEHVYVTASIVKVDILAALLLQAQEAGRQPTDTQRKDSEVMIRLSDNDSTWRLWDAVGTSDGLSRANVALGLKETVTTPATWGLTETTAADQLRLLMTLFDEESALDATSRGYLLDLMGRVAPDQAWGVSAAADPGTTPVLKNGWLPRNDTNLWVVNSIGRITHDGRTMLVTVLSDDQRSKEAGIAQMETVVKAVVPAMAAAVAEQPAPAAETSPEPPAPAEESRLPAGG